ncbi:Hypothetical predicted protein [Xyrichtys novacula]|uniref:Uncharacterized protein n=1 Tax=Xyrichtys novacula TaxID=13765 RepID=A0AAV1H531_XYRNO|nr:Hypothetical predicted protein [Xyrichtys novacula]
MADGVETCSPLFSRYTLLLLGGLIEAAQQRGESVVMTVENGRCTSQQTAPLAKKKLKVRVGPWEL